MQGLFLLYWASYLFLSRFEQRGLSRNIKSDFNSTTPCFKIKIEFNRILSIQMIAEETSKPKESKEKLKKFELKTWIIKCLERLWEKELSVQWNLESILSQEKRLLSEYLKRTIFLKYQMWKELLVKFIFWGWLDIKNITQPYKWSKLESSSI